ncbi:MAG: hypothetical protein NTZ48_04210 [Candidatus Omnitrophica bacterium]|nr:hypothetical protein [Candidatus Omnitrophota bacterium]
MLTTPDFNTTTQPLPVHSTLNNIFSNTKFDFSRNIPNSTDSQEPASEERLPISTEMITTGEISPDTEARPKSNFLQVKVSKHPEIILRATYGQYLTNALNGLRGNLENPSGSIYLSDFRKNIDAINRLSAEGSIEESFRYFVNAINLYLVEKHWSEFTQNDIDIVQAAIKEVTSKDNLKIIHANKILRRIRKKGLNIHSFLSGINWVANDGGEIDD